MPYIITTTKHLNDPSGGVDQTARRAVAALDEAWSHVFGAVQKFEIWSDGEDRIRRLIPESGGTVGPLPDGTVIEVARIGWKDLRSGAALGPKAVANEAEAITEAVADYNAAQEAGR